jgi:hypothetical protein
MSWSLPTLNGLYAVDGYFDVKGVLEEIPSNNEEIEIVIEVQKGIPTDVTTTTNGGYTFTSYSVPVGGWVYPMSHTESVYNYYTDSYYDQVQTRPPSVVEGQVYVFNK